MAVSGEVMTGMEWLAKHGRQPLRLKTFRAELQYGWTAATKREHGLPQSVIGILAVDGIEGCYSPTLEEAYLRAADAVEKCLRDGTLQ